ncbi:DinI family protein [Klebsiella aerogenes]|uniref:DinI family protein n=1 Tax=Klebsiella aerogenes TaxID=548 RepID=UPI002A81B444|nr:DinI family protein [Klebsiella aerogenes]WPR95447.1 DinI family protein [Klebsiella aerogenes]
MRIELTIDKKKELPDGAVPALEKELLRRISADYDDCSIRIRRSSMDGLTVTGCEKSDRERIEEILQETWETADDWFY